MQKIGFGNKDFYVVDFFEYKGERYYYIIEDIYKEGMDVNNPTGNVEINFIYKCSDGNFENVVDDKLFRQLMNFETERTLEGKNNIIKK